MVKIMENPIQMDDLGVPLFLETSKSCLFSAGDGVIVGVAWERARYLKRISNRDIQNIIFSHWKEALLLRFCFGELL